MREAIEGSVRIDDAQPAVVELLLAFLYTGALDNRLAGHAAEMLPLAHRLEISELMDHCAEILVQALTLENAASTVSVLRAYHDDPVIGPHWDNVCFKVQADIRLVHIVMVGNLS